MEFMYYLLGGMMDLIVFIIMMPLLPFMRIINSKKLNTFTEEILTRLFGKEGLF